MAKFYQVSAVLIVIFGVFSLSQTAGFLDILNNPAALESRLNDQAFVQRNFACVLDQRPCDVFGSVAKLAVREVITNGCARCTQQQRINAQGLAALMAQRFPRQWSEVLAKYQYRRG